MRALDPRRVLARSLRLAAALMCIGPGPLASQVIRGTIRDSRSDRTIADATIVLLLQDSVEVALTMSDSAGSFLVSPPRPGAYYVAVRRLGYQPVRDGPVQLDQGDTLEVAIHIRPAPVLLDTATVVAERRNHLERVGFYERKRTGFGHFLEREQLEDEIEIARTWVDLLRSVPGVTVAESGRVGRGRTFRMSTGMASIAGCSVPRVYVDGMLVTSNLGSLEEQLSSLNEVLKPHDLEAIEVYRRPSEVPAQYGGAESGCGVILVWSRRGR